MIETLNTVDMEVFLWLNALHSDFLDPIMYIISETRTWVPFYLFLIYLMYRNTPNLKFFLVSIISIILIISASDRTTSGVIKPYTQRLRPTHEKALAQKVHIVYDYRGGTYGFASSHAANTFGLAMFLFLMFRKIWQYSYLLFLWALIVSYSRIYLGVHYPLDILAGAGVGVLYALLFFQIQTYFLKTPELSQREL